MQEERYELVEVVIVEESLQLLHLALHVRSSLDFCGVHVKIGDDAPEISELSGLE